MTKHVNKKNIYLNKNNMREIHQNIKKIVHTKVFSGKLEEEKKQLIKEIEEKILEKIHLDTWETDIITLRKYRLTSMFTNLSIIYSEDKCDFMFSSWAKGLLLFKEEVELYGFQRYDRIGEIIEIINENKKIKDLCLRAYEIQDKLFKCI